MSPWSPRRQAVVAAACLALLVRLAHLQIVRDTVLLDLHRLYDQSDMYQFDQWARRIAGGDVLGRAVYHPLAQWQIAAAPAEKWERWYGDAPVFFKAPAYPYLIALQYRLLGDSMFPVALLQILASAASVVLLFGITERLFGQAAGLGAALLLALYGPDVHFDVVMLRGPWIVLTSLLATWCLMEVRDRPGLRRAALLGLALGLALLVNEGFLTVPPLVVIVLATWFRDVRRLAGLVAAVLLGLAAALAPVVVRNLIVGAPALKLAVTGSTVYAVFNAAGTSPYFLQWRFSAFVPILERSGGELAGAVVGCLRSFDGPGSVLLFYLRKACGLLIPFENPDNVNFYYAALKDPLLRALPAYGALFSLAIVGTVLAARRWRSLAALVPMALSLLLLNLMTLPLSRYRATLAVFLMPVAGLALAQGTAWLREGRWRALGALVLGALLTSLAGRAIEEWVVFADQPRELLVYRPSEFWAAADLYAGQGRGADAVRELLEVARLNPSPQVRASALVRVGLIEAGRGHAAAAREALEGSRLLGSRDPLLMLAVGDAYRNALHDAESALACYRRAAELPSSPELRGLIQQRLLLEDSSRVQ